MSWEYKRVLLEVSKPTTLHEDSVETLFNSLGKEGWLLRTAVNLDSGSDSGCVRLHDTIEYIFYRENN